MAMSTYICVCLVSLISMAASQVPDPSLNSISGGTGLGSLLNNMAPSSGFAPATGLNSLPPNMNFPTLGMSTPMGAMPAAQQSQNPMGNFLPYLVMSGADMSNMMMMMMAMSGRGGGGGGFFSNPLAMLMMGNNM